MSYGDFKLTDVEPRLGLTIAREKLFSQIEPLATPNWLQEALERGLQIGIASEKARSEFIVAPILLAAREVTGNGFSIYSGEKLDVDAARGLTGECDFILARTPQLPLLKAPIITLVEAKKHDIEEGLGQCIAQMVGARCFNRTTGDGPEIIFGSVTTGEDWQFLKLEQDVVKFDTQRYYIDNVGKILGVFKAIVDYFGS